MVASAAGRRGGTAGRRSQRRLTLGGRPGGDPAGPGHPEGTPRPARRGDAARHGAAGRLAARRDRHGRVAADRGGGRARTRCVAAARRGTRSGRHRSPFRSGSLSATSWSSGGDARSTRPTCPRRREARDGAPAARHRGRCHRRPGHRRVRRAGARRRLRPTGGGGGSRWASGLDAAVPRGQPRRPRRRRVPPVRPRHAQDRGGGLRRRAGARVGRGDPLDRPDGQRWRRAAWCPGASSAGRAAGTP